MDYQKIYNQIVNRAKNRKLEGYKEKHHIIPKCLNGLDDKENLVELTAREHFLVHMLLCNIYPKENKLKHALFLMAIGKQKVKEKTYIIGSRVYERLKKEYSEFLTGKKQTQETRNKKSKTMKKVWASKSEKEIKKIRKKAVETRKSNGDWHSKEWKQDQSQRLKGRKITWDRGRNKIVYQLDINNKIIKEFESANEADRVMGGKGQNVACCCTGKQKTAYGFKWCYKKNYKV